MHNPKKKDHHHAGPETFQAIDDNPTLSYYIKTHFYMTNIGGLNATGVVRHLQNSYDAETANYFFRNVFRLPKTITSDFWNTQPDIG